MARLLAARVPGDFLFPLPAGPGFKQAHMLSAGVTAAMGLRQLEKHDLTPQRGPVLVTEEDMRFKKFRMQRALKLKQA